MTDVLEMNPWQMPSERLASVTDVEAAHRKHAQAVDKIRDLEARLEQDFQRLHDARQDLKERARIDAVMAAGEWSEPLVCAWERWTAINEARSRAEAPPSQAESDRVRENQALALANRGAE